MKFRKINNKKSFYVNYLSFINFSGFTIIEVLVALIIVAIALITSLHAIANLANNELNLNKRLLAEWSADNYLSELYFSTNWPPLGSRKFNCSQGDLELICTEKVHITPNPIFRRIEIIVKERGFNVELARIVTIIPKKINRPL